jgi:lysozyme family protein
MTDIDVQLDALIAREGGYIDHPADRGGPTRFGITEAVARSAGYAGTIRHLPLGEAKRIYRQRYWTAPGLPLMATTMPRLAAELFDTGVNMGPSVAAQFLQRALNALNRRARDWPDVPVSGRIDAATLAALEAARAYRGAALEDVLLKAVDALQGARYIALAEARPLNEAFVYGWLDKRVGVAA